MGCFSELPCSLVVRLLFGLSHTDSGYTVAILLVILCRLVWDIWMASFSRRVAVSLFILFATNIIQLLQMTGFSCLPRRLFRWGNGSLHSHATLNRWLAAWLFTLAIIFVRKVSRFTWVRSWVTPSCLLFSLRVKVTLFVFVLNGFATRSPHANVNISVRMFILGRHGGVCRRRDRCGSGSGQGGGWGTGATVTDCLFVETTGLFRKPAAKMPSWKIKSEREGERERQTKEWKNGKEIDILDGILSRRQRT